mgnify:CR=1 FL=1
MIGRPIAMTDIETTGLDPMVHEIIEIGLLVVHQETFKVMDRLDLKVRPEHIETAQSEALKVNGYLKEDWGGAISLKEAMMLFGEKTRGTVFCAHNVTFDWSFICEAFRRTRVENELDYHRIDLFTLAWAKLRKEGLEHFTMNAVAKYLGIPEETSPHRAMGGATVACEVYKKLMK